LKQKIDILLRRAKVYDGSGSEAFDADIAVAGDRIVQILPGGQFKDKAISVIDALGLSVAPGFIDTHAHSEFTLLADRRAEGKIFQGITTEINGNCGLSAAPLYGDAATYREADLRDLGIRKRWSTFEEYFRILGGDGLAINFATLAGHGNIRASVVGYTDRRPDREEEARMQGLLLDAVQAGAIGLSTGLIYPPGVYAGTDELIGLSRSINDLLYTTHMRSEGDTLIEAIEETIRIGKDSGIAVHVSHIKTGGRQNWRKIDRAVALLEGALAEGLRVTADRYPYTASFTDLDSVLPSWTFIGGADAELKRLEDEEARMRIRDEVLREHPTADYWRSIAIASLDRESNKWMEGRRLSDIAEALGKKPVEFLLDILREERLRVGAIFHSMNEDNLRRFLSLPYVMIGSDSSARSSDGPTRKGKPHPRGFGTFPRFIGGFVRDQKQMSISEAIHKCTMLPAETFGLAGRGQIRIGCIADLVIFDEEKIIDKATFEEPFLKPEGIPYVFINGLLAVQEGSQTGVLAGRILRHGR